MNFYTAKECFLLFCLFVVVFVVAFCVLLLLFLLLLYSLFDKIKKRSSKIVHMNAKCLISIHFDRRF